MPYTPPVGPRPPVPPGHAKCVLSGTWQGHQVRTIFYLKVDGSAITVNDLTSLATDIFTQWSTHTMVNLSSTYILTNVTVVYVPSVGSELVGTHSGSVAGGNTNAPVADASAAYVIDWHIPAYYRGGHPHSNVPGPVTLAITNGSDVDGAVASTLATNANTFRNNVNALTYTSITGVELGTLSFQTSTASVGVWRTPPLFRAYQSVGVRLKLGSVRRRIFS